MICQDHGQAIVPTLEKLEEWCPPRTIGLNVIDFLIIVHIRAA